MLEMRYSISFNCVLNILTEKSITQKNNDKKMSTLQLIKIDHVNSGIKQTSLYFQTQFW